MRVPLPLAAPLFALPLLATPALADLTAAVEQVILPGYADFAETTAALNATLQAQTQCDPEALRPAFNAAFDAWAAVSWLHIGPSEEEGRALAIYFWPDPKGLGAKAQRGLLLGDPANLAQEAFAAQSVAARGLTGLERLLYPKDPAEADPCPLIGATARDLARLGQELDKGWTSPDGFAQLLQTAGAAGNARYMSATEADQAIFTQLMGGLEFISDQQLGRPLGTDAKPRPERAQSRASGRAMRNIQISLRAIRDLSATLAPEAKATLAALDQAVAAADALNEPLLSGVEEPEQRDKILALQELVRTARHTALSEMAPALGVDLGFNSQDGD